MNAGIDSFFEPPNTVDSHTCRACGATCRVERGRVGPTSWAGALGDAQTPHDYFSCPNSDEKWHEQAVKLFQAIEATPGERVAELLRQDLFDLLSKHGCIPDN